MARFNPIKDIKNTSRECCWLGFSRVNGRLCVFVWHFDWPVKLFGTIGFMATNRISLIRAVLVSKVM